uniref:Uncharacterized protein n=1 Tax=Cyprinus carpio TaxID=7962 RepID=A0A8C1JW58_CYPCA
VDNGYISFCLETTPSLSRAEILSLADLDKSHFRGQRRARSPGLRLLEQTRVTQSLFTDPEQGVLGRDVCQE